MSTSALATTAAPPASPALVVYGLDDGGKPHASLFAAPDADLAEKAAGLMSMRAFRLTAPDHLTTVAGLPQGRVFASGRAFVPFVKRALYDRLTALGGAPAAKPTLRSTAPKAGPGKTKAADGAELTDGKAGNAGPAEAATSAPAKHTNPLAAGMVVLAPEIGASWWEAVVVSAKGESVTLKWRDFPDERPFQRRRDQIAFLPGGYEPPV